MYKTKTITAENQWTETLDLIGFFNYSAQGEFDATITLQKSYNDSGIWSAWEDVDSNTEPFSLVGFEPLAPFKFSKPSVRYRLGIKAGEFTSGSIYARLGVR
jgi:hypothetical protein